LAEQNRRTNNDEAQVNEYVRSACLQALMVLVAEEKLSREHVVDYFHSLFHGGLEREPGFIWSALVSDSCDLYPEELLHDIQQAYDDGLVDPLFVGMDSVRDALSRGKEEALRSFRQHRGGLIDDTVAEMNWWACFTEDTDASTNEYPTRVQNLRSNGRRLVATTPVPAAAGRSTRNAVCINRLSRHGVEEYGAQTEA